MGTCIFRAGGYDGIVTRHTFRLWIGLGMSEVHSNRDPSEHPEEPKEETFVASEMESRYTIGRGWNTIGDRGVLVGCCG